MELKKIKKRKKINQQNLRNFKLNNFIIYIKPSNQLCIEDIFFYLILEYI